MRQCFVYIFGAALVTCSAPQDDEPVIWGEVDPVFTQALKQYENWGKSCEPGNPAREAGIKAGVFLFKVDALTCTYQRLKTAEDQDLETVVEVAGRLYGMTGDVDLRNVGQCRLDHETRIDLQFETMEKSGELVHQPTTQSLTLPAQFYERTEDFYACPDDYIYGRPPAE